MTPHQCETGCGKPAPTTTICNHCLTDIEQQYLELPDGALTSLQAMAYGEETTPNMGRRRATNHHDVLNINIYELMERLAHFWFAFEKLQTQPGAGNTVLQTRKDIQQATQLLDPQETAYTAEHIAARMKQIRPRTPGHLSAFMKDKLGVHVPAGRIRMMIYQGRLKPAYKDSNGHHYIHPVALLHALKEGREKTPGLHH